MITHADRQIAYNTATVRLLTDHVMFNVYVYGVKCKVRFNVKVKKMSDVTETSVELESAKPDLSDTVVRITLILLS